MEQNLIKSEIESRIFTIRGEQVMFDFDLAKLYEIPTKSFNQSVNRNLNRFPSDFIFRLNAAEFQELVTNCDRLRNQKHRSSYPLAFTELGISIMKWELRSSNHEVPTTNIMRLSTYFNTLTLLIYFWLMLVNTQ